MSYYYSFVLEEKHGFNKKTIGLFIKDDVLETLISLILTAPVLFGILYIIQHGGQFFYIYLEIFVIIFIFIMMTIYPNFIAPLFNKFEELPEGSLRTKIN